MIQRVIAAHWRPPSPPSFLALSQPPAAAGSTVTATSIEIATAIAVVIARSPKSWPSMSSRNSTGRNTANVVTVEANSAPTTWRVPW